MILLFAPGSHRTKPQYPMSDTPIAARHGDTASTLVLASRQITLGCQRMQASCCLHPFACSLRLVSYTVTFLPVSATRFPAKAHPPFNAPSHRFKSVSHRAHRALSLCRLIARTSRLDSCNSSFSRFQASIKPEEDPETKLARAIGARRMWCHAHHFSTNRDAKAAVIGRAACRSILV